MSNLYQQIAQEYLFWIVTGSAGCLSLGQYWRSKSWGQSLSVFLLGMVVSWAIVSIPTVRDIVGQFILWLIGLLNFG